MKRIDDTSLMLGVKSCTESIFDIIARQNQKSLPPSIGQVDLFILHNDHFSKPNSKHKLSINDAVR